MSKCDKDQSCKWWDGGWDGGYCMVGTSTHKKCHMDGKDIKLGRGQIEMMPDGNSVLKERDTARRWARVWRNAAVWFRGVVNSQQLLNRGLARENYKLRAELAELRGRTCAGCKWHRNEDHDGACFLPQVMKWEGVCVPAPDGHYCKAWEKK